MPFPKLFSCLIIKDILEIIFNSRVGNMTRSVTAGHRADSLTLKFYIWPTPVIFFKIEELIFMKFDDYVKLQ